MLSFVSSILSGLNQARNYKTQAAITRANAKTQQALANTHAADIMRSARANWDIEVDKQKSMRQQQTSAVASSRAAQGNSGFTSEGTASQSTATLSNAYDETIANMARSAAIDYNNHFLTAEATKTQARLQRSALESQARQYDIAAHASKQSAIIGGTAGLVSSIAGYVITSGAAEQYNSKNAEAISSGQLTALNPIAMGLLGATTFAGDITNNVMSFNNFTSSLTRKNNWQSYTALALGNTPGFQFSDSTL